MSATNDSFQGGSVTLEGVCAAALELPADARAALVERLWDSLQPELTAEIQEAWELEIDRRVEEISNGKATLIPGEEVFRAIRERYAR